MFGGYDYWDMDRGSFVMVKVCWFVCFVNICWIVVYCGINLCLKLFVCSNVYYF